jgi:hypothetical protein
MSDMRSPEESPAEKELWRKVSSKDLMLAATLITDTLPGINSTVGGKIDWVDIHNSIREPRQASTGYYSNADGVDLDRGFIAGVRIVEDPDVGIVVINYLLDNSTKGFSVNRRYCKTWDDVYRPLSDIEKMDQLEKLKRGLCYPQETDWDDFIQLLEAGKAESTRRQVWEKDVLRSEQD